MKTPRLKLDFVRLSDPELEIKAQAIVAAMTDNTYFTTPVPALTVVNSHITAYATALSKALTRDKAEVANKNLMRSLLEKTLMDLAGYVTFTSGGSEAALVSSGFDLAKPAANLPPISVPDNFSVGNGVNEGEVVSSVDRVTGARSYIHEYTADPLTPTSEWTQQFTTVRKATITDLEPGKKYWFRVAAIGPRQQIAYTNVQLRMAA
ncbi:hypothetical protein D3H65_04950 [Paraflavitalea soli]|uniref:Fibronectin type III domain-containing protein n=1 Tax=Paraflavitalea soli TaxID=2315862 RepID=A0A3B7MP72_9BACT|nr:fibronectin type III domain-containing protein [Paraflavitalea soli]AXY73365.1 hypothetical protein D3H65_04950 [Paraflavitalea soli]